MKQYLVYNFITWSNFNFTLEKKILFFRITYYFILLFFFPPLYSWMFLLNYSSILTFLLFTCLASISESLSSITQNDHDDYERKLIQKLFTNYSKNQKPPGSVQIKFALNLNQIINVIEKDQIFLLNVFVDHEWFDPRITWNPADFNNITVLRISSELLWM